MIQNLLGKIIGFLVIIITLALSPTIYAANSDIVGYEGGLDTFIGMAAIAGFGGFIIILGLLVSGGLFAIAGVRGKIGGAGWSDIMKVVGAVIVVIVMLTMFITILDYVADLITAATGEGDTIGETMFGIIPILIYVGILAAAGWAHVTTYRKLRTGRRVARTAYA